MLKEKYEISLWEDYLVSAVYDGDEIVVPEHYVERKLAIIGSNTMTAQWRAIEPKLVENINGTNTFTFKMYYTYIDNETGEKMQNPFSKLMVNERKVKALWKNKWYDLVIKSIQEDSNGKSYTYTCKDLYINELSKTGFDLEFDEKLGNNLGTVTELGERVVEGTDWKIDLDNSDIIEQLTEEAVFEVSGIDMTGSFEVDGITISTEKDAKLLVFYSTVINQNPLFQFLYSKEGKFSTEENEMLVVNMPVYSVEGAQWSKNEEVYTVQIDEATITFSLAEKVSTRYRAKRPVRQQKQVYDPTIEEYVYVYKDANEKEVYGVEHTEFNSPIVVVNLLTNYSNFSNTEGWLTNQGEGAITFWQLPEYTAEDWANYQGISYLRLLLDEGKTSGNFLNRGIKLNTQYLPDGFMPGEKYIVRIKAFEISDAGALSTQIEANNIIVPSIGEYDKESYSIIEEKEYFEIDHFDFKKYPVKDSEETDNWLEYELTCKKALSRSDLLTTSNFGLVFQLSTSLYIQEVQLFKEVFGEQIEIVDDKETRTKVRINPGEIEKQGIIKPVYIYYDPEVNSEATSWEDLIALQRVYEKSSDYTPVYNTEKVTDKDGNEKQVEQKIRSITAKNSNRFNLLQQLAETFECWVRFNIEHESDGAVKLINGLPQKTVTFKQEIGQRTGIGFVYGIDLKQISRTINSDKITSKVIVQPNINELAEDGICTIANSTENYSRASFILNFDYYINHGLLDGNVLTKDLYLNTSDSIGYYYNLNRLNIESQLNAKELIQQKKAQLEQDSMLKTYTEALTVVQEQVNQLENDIIQQAGVNKWEEVESYAIANPNDTKLISKMQAKARLEANRDDYQKLVNSLTSAKKNLDDLINTLNIRQDEIVEEIKTLDLRFYEKYSRYIQEGSWNSQDYIDPNYYYLDAQSVAYTSSRPQITYNISVLRLTALQEYRNKVFLLGDISFIQDAEFFGFMSDGYTPYKEEVLVSEIVSNFDSPEKDSFKIQNYKTQFEDLFQRITATTQSLQYASGEYQRAANVIEPDGTINTTTLANSLAINQQLVISAQNETIIQDNTGITLTDASNPNNKVKLTSGGIFLSTDGGLTWKGGIRGTGISTQYLTAGSINTNNIVIQDGEHTAFRWDSDGINAFSKKTDSDGQYEYADLSTFVRFDQYGIYGINNYGEAFSPKSESEVWDKANFALTWKGFLLRNKIGSGYIEISTDKDITLNDGFYDRIHIGRFSDTGETTEYGIRIKDATGATVMETDSDGMLWLKDRLNIGTSDSNYQVGIGNLGKSDNDEVNRVIDANNKFIVYEDGSVTATDGNFTGTINATGGQIGNLTIAQVESGIANVGKQKIASIIASSTTFVNSNPSVITLTAELSNAVGVLSYQWYKDNNVLSGEVNNKLSIAPTNLDGNSGAIYKVEITENIDGETSIFTASVGIQRIINDTDTIIYHLESSQPKISKSYIGGTGKDNLVFSSNTISFYPYKLTDEDREAVSLGDYSVVFEALLNNNTEWRDIVEILNNIEDALISDTTNQCWIVDLGKVFNSNLGDSLLEDFKIALEQEEFAIRAKLTVKGKENEVLAIAIVPIEFGSNNDMAKLAINAYDINASIGEAGLKFSAEGLQIKNGSFEIVSDEDEKVLYLDKESGNLTIKGTIYADSGVFNGTVNATDGVFNGTVNAIDGSFRGNVEATTGSLGDLSVNGAISLGNIILNGSSSNQGIYTQSFLENPETGFYIGSDGSIIANDIILGTSATIGDYLKLGNGYIYNPDAEGNSGKFISVLDNQNKETIAILQDGTIKLGENGNLILNGNNGSISTSDYSLNTGWKIDNNEAIFNNITARGSIKASVLEYGTVQAVGGIIIVRPSSIIKDISKIEGTFYFKVEDVSMFSVNDYVRFGANLDETNENIDATYYQITGVSVPDSTVTINITFSDEEEASAYIGTALINFGNSNSYGIGINSSNNGSLISPHSITLFEHKVSEGTHVLENRIILGEIPGNTISGIAENTWGLYADNVYLRGSLIAEEKGSYASGINTASEAMMPNEGYFPNASTGNILLWAGAKNSTRQAIEAAPFKVDVYGNLYASSGYFKGTIITDATITASEIKTAVITGTGEEEGEPALLIKDTDKGIHFIGNKGTVLDVSTSGMILNTSLSLSDKTVLAPNSSTFPRIYIRKSFESETIGIFPNEFGFIDISDAERDAFLSSLRYENNQLKIYTGGADSLDIDLDRTVVKSNTFNASNIVEFGDKTKGVQMIYKPVLSEAGLIGYDLYIE